MAAERIDDIFTSLWEDEAGFAEMIGAIAGRAVRLALDGCPETGSDRSLLESYAKDVPAVVALGMIRRAEEVLAVETSAVDRQPMSKPGQGRLLTALNWCVALIAALKRARKAELRGQLEWAVDEWGEAVLPE